MPVAGSRTVVVVAHIVVVEEVLDIVVDIEELAVMPDVVVVAADTVVSLPVDTPVAVEDTETQEGTQQLAVDRWVVVGLPDRPAADSKLVPTNGSASEEPKRNHQTGCCYCWYRSTNPQPRRPIARVDEVATEVDSVECKRKLCQQQERGKA